MTRERKAQLVVALPRARAEAAAVDAKDCWQRAGRILWACNVELEMLVGGIGELDAPLESDVVWNGEFGGGCERD